MGGRGFEVAAADCAAVAPRLEDAADALAGSLRRAVGELQGNAPFWGADSAFGRGYLEGWGAAVDLAASCEQALRDTAAKLLSVARAYQAADTSAAAAFGALGSLGTDALGVSGRAGLSG